MNRKFKLNSKPEYPLCESTERQKKFMIFSKRAIYCRSCPSIEDVIRSYLLHLNVIPGHYTDIINCICKYEADKNYDALFKALNDFIRSDYDSVLYFVALDDKFVWKNPTEYMFDKDVNYYNENTKNMTEEEHELSNSDPYSIFYGEISLSNS